MSETPETPETLAARTPDAQPHDLCAVALADDGVVICWGHRQELGGGAVGAALDLRVTLGRAGAAQLQDMMTALLQEAASASGSVR